MKYAIFGDIHGNLEALEAVLADMEEQGITHLLCLGDLVGYGANPAECLEIVRATGCPVVLG
ncbi:MAG: metallophosphatase family protein, partial [Alphaproteobacteria bacterium]|nr:metallophosphatase family protein [Alphaproteobacteria bacterium]